MIKISEQIKKAKHLMNKLQELIRQDSISKEMHSTVDDASKDLLSDLFKKGEYEDYASQRSAMDLDAEWDRFLEGMASKRESGGKVIQMKRYRKLIAVAAIAVMVFSAGLFYFTFTPSDSIHSVAESDIKPGFTKARLILDNGQEVALEETGIERIEEEGLTIQNDGGVLAYEVVDKQSEGAPVINRLQIPRGGEYQVLLPDSTRVWLNSESELVYTIPFSGPQRRVSLKGEAYFDVAHDADHPFVVATAFQEVIVLGTEFNITAYEDDNQVITTLVEGKVKMVHGSEQVGKFEEILLPNEQLIYDKITSVPVKQVVDTKNYTSWKEGRFKFNNESLESLIIKLSRWYDVEVIITDDSIKDIRFTGDLPRYNNMADILTILEVEMSVHVKIDDNKIIYLSR